MMWQEFNRLSGAVATADMYYSEIEPLYMLFDWLQKEDMVVMYWGRKRGAYALWLVGCDLRRELAALQDSCLGDEYMDVWRRKAADYRQKVEALRKADTI